MKTREIVEGRKKLKEGEEIEDRMRVRRKRRRERGGG